MVTHFLSYESFKKDEQDMMGTTGEGSTNL